MASDASMSFLDHLEELRRRIIISLIAITICILISLWFKDPAVEIIRRPVDIPLNVQLANWIDRSVGSNGSFMAFLSIALKAKAASTVQLNKTGAGEAIMAFLKIAVTFGVLLASPIVLYQAWAFVFPALTQQERKFALPLFLIIVFFFLVGVVFAYFIVLPVVVQFAAGLFANVGVGNLWSIDRYVGFATNMLLAFGVAFELPIVMAFLSRIGVINAQGFRERQRYAIMFIFVAAALLTPADLLSMLLMAIPLILLYQLGIFLAFLAEQEPESNA
ncbi:twin-arginine translocase subunit TatC [Candidatus Poribacteria bacterium]|nr:MAG: twin-arginine translocase subunit TatC [Candidatus Poribacteria bacterium]